MQIEKALTNDRLPVLKFCLLFSSKVSHFLTVSIVFLVYKQNFTAQ